MNVPGESYMLDTAGLICEQKPRWLSMLAFRLDDSSGDGASDGRMTGQRLGMRNDANAGRTSRLVEMSFA